MGLSEALLQGMAEATCLGVMTTDDNLKITGWNHWLETNSGIPSIDLVGRSVLEAFPELVSRRLERYYRQAISGQMVLLSQRLHGYLLPFPPSVAEIGLPRMPQSVRIAPILNQGRVVGTVTVIEDATERYVNEAALRARAREQAAVAALSQQALAGGDLDALLQETAKTLSDVFDVEYCQVLTLLPKKQVLSQRACSGWKDAQLGAEAMVGPGSFLEYALTSGQPVIVKDFAIETRFQITPGMREMKIASAAGVPIFSGKKPFGVIAVYKCTRRVFTDEDIRVLQAVASLLGFAVERGHLEQQLRQRVDDLAGEAQRKDEFLAMLSHELRNPLAPIRNAVQIIRLAGAANSSVKQASEIVDRQVQHMVRLVDDLLDVSRISRGKIQLHKEMIDLASVLVRAVESVRPLIDLRGHELTLTYPQQPVWVYGDATRLVQVLANLLNNAAKYTDAGGHIWLTAGREGDEAVLSVRDTGIGIPADLLPHVFDLFVQSNRALDRSEGGLGIGLTLARRLVEMHNGKITVSSGGIGFGSEFVIRLAASPDREMPVADKAPDRESRHIPPSARRRVLIVDDNVDSAASLAMLLQLHLHDVRVAHDGKTALAEVSTSRPEIVFLDIGLPGMDGYEVARKLRSEYDHKSLTLIAMTGYGHEDDRRNSQAAGFNAHLVKPADLDAILEFLKRTSDAIDSSD